MNKVVGVPRFGDIITERPKNMAYNEYRRRLRIQNKRLKRRLSGFWVWKSKAVLSLEMKSFGMTGVGCESHGTLVGPVSEIRIQ